MAQKTVTVTAKKIASRIEHTKHSVLPPAKKLAEELGVSYSSVLKALVILENRGIVRCRRGKPTEILKTYNLNLSEIEPPSAASKLAQKLWQRIASGHYQTGVPFPSSSYLTREFRVSSHTLQEAFAQLETQKRIHREGTRWVVGPEIVTENVACGDSRSAPTIVVVLPGTLRYWQFYSHPHFQQFVTIWNIELQKSGFRQHLVIANLDQKQPSFATTGIDNAERLIRDLGENYRGALVNISGDTENLGMWLRVLCKFDAPVVYYDSTGQGGEFVRGKDGLTDSFFRLYFDEYEAIRLALQTFADQGHRTVGFPNIARHMVPAWHSQYGRFRDKAGSSQDRPTTADGKTYWTSRRIEYASSTAALLKPSIDVRSAMHSESFWAFGMKGNERPFSERVATSLNVNSDVRIHNVRNASQALLQGTPSLVSLLREGVTAILALNDAMALDYHEWFRAVGIEIPDKISLMSFDNRSESVVAPISTIDFGFYRLGFLAAHLFLRDMPIRTDHRGWLRGHCSFIDRGSVSRPGKEPLSLPGISLPESEINSSDPWDLT